MPPGGGKKIPPAAGSLPADPLINFCDLLKKVQENPLKNKLARPLGSLWKTLEYNQKLAGLDEILQLKLHPNSEPFLECIGLQDIAVQKQIERKMLARLQSDAPSLGQGEVTRLITIHPNSVQDPEVEDAVYLQLKKHDPMTCLIRTSLEGIKEVFNSERALKTVIPIGHGFTAKKNLIYNCGPIQGLHDDVAKAWSNLLLTEAPQVQHLRLVSCYYGSTNPAFDDTVHGDIQYKKDAHHNLENGTMTATVTYKPSEPLPFHPESMAGLIWENLVVKGGRKNFCLSATPLILNPLPPKDPRFFAATDEDHYTGGKGIGKPMWQDAKIRKLDKTKSITLATPDSFKIAPEPSDLPTNTFTM